MKRTLTNAFFFALVYFFPFTIKSEDKKPALSDLRWLSGCWEGGDSLRRYEEHWMKPAGTSILGMSHTVTEGETIAYEFLRIQQQKEGATYYVANPSGQTQDSFKLVNAKMDELVFENPQHDFPQRIVYRLNGESLIARIEGTSKGKRRSSTFPMVKVKCD